MIENPEPDDIGHLLPQDIWDQVIADVPNHATDPVDVDYRELSDVDDKDTE